MVFQQERRGSMNTRVCAVSFYRAETPLASIKQLQTTLPVMSSDVVA